MKKQIIHLSPTMSPMSFETFPWACFSALATREVSFEMFLACNRYMKLAKWILCNSAYELESATFMSFPGMLPIGPLSASNYLGDKCGSFWPEDSACLSWLDQQPACSVIYIAHGSSAVFDQTKDVYPEGFKEGIGSRGKIVSWTPQVKVLQHPLIALEGVSNGVPFLCWPYFGDQLSNQTCICDVWKVGLRCDKDETGIITKSEIVNNFKARAMNLKDKVLDSVSRDGSSDKNLSKFLNF